MTTTSTLAVMQAFKTFTQAGHRFTEVWARGTDMGFIIIRQGDDRAVSVIYDSQTKELRFFQPKNIEVYALLLGSVIVQDTVWDTHMSIHFLASVSQGDWSWLEFIEKADYQ